MSDFLKRKQRYIWIALFAIILVIGFTVYRDYGVSVDEPTERLNDIMSYVEMNKALFHRIPPVFRDKAEEFDIASYADRYYGVAVRFPLMLIEDFHFEQSGTGFSNQEIYYIRHLYCWLLYVGALLSFYFLIRRMTGKDLIACVGVLMLFLFGRFFASSFYDVKDMVFVSLVIYSIACAERVFATNRKKRWCLLFAFCSALAVTARVVAAIIDILMIILLLAEDIKRRSERRFSLQLLFPYLIILCAFPIYLLMSPVSWKDPIKYCMGVVNTFSSYDVFFTDLLFGGRMMRVDATHKNPWDYTIRWMFLTLPLVCMALGGIGAVLFLSRSFKKQSTSDSAGVQNTLWMAGIFFIGTLAYQILRRPVMYNSWRHSFYLYPLLVIFAMYALDIICKNRNVIKWATISAVCLSLCYQAVQLVQLHPFEMVQMNPIGQTVIEEYEGDYWGLSGKYAHEWVLENDKRADIKIYGIPINSGPGPLFIPSMLTLDASDAARLRLAGIEYNPDYFETIERVCTVPENYELVKQFMVYDHVPVCSIYKRIPQTETE